MKRNERMISLLMLLCLIVAAGTVQAGERDPAPQVRIWAPYAQGAVTLPPGFDFTLRAHDNDVAGNIPLKYRYLLVEADAGGIEITNQYTFENYGRELVAFHQPGWSEWRNFRLAESQPPSLDLPALEEDTYYLLAVQVLDADGVPSLAQDYGQQVLNFRFVSGMFRPEVHVYDQYLGPVNLSANLEIASGQPLNFEVQASAEMYNAQIRSIRYGWDLIDPDDPDDPAWFEPTAYGVDYLLIPERTFNSGVHVLTVRVVDSLDQVRSGQITLTVIPFVDPQYQMPLLFIDQVVDSNSGRWPSQDGGIAYDRGSLRDSFWRHLDQAGGVAGFDWEQDHVADTEFVSYSDLVTYKSVLITARKHQDQTLFQLFRPENGQDRYVWLHPYQQRGGNLFLVGERAMESFLPTESYMTPIVFDNPEDTYFFQGDDYVIGFGMRTLPDGSEVVRGRTMYPYLTAGISSLDWATPANKHLYGRGDHEGAQDRRRRCVGLKAMVLDADFRANHGIAAGTLADTIYTDADIDWYDPLPAQNDTLLQTIYPFGDDEFVDAAINETPAPVVPQQCADGPDGMCVEPMYEGLSRFDYLRNEQWAAGNADWPYNTYTYDDLRSLCGPMALTTYEGPDGEVLPNGSARTNGLTYGFLSYKNVAAKPGGQADVYWGFDPYRFDHDDSKAAVRWVLEYFGLAMEP